jgi:hypothetical protein
MLAGAESATDCGGWLVAGFSYNGTEVTSCPLDHYCPGGDYYKGATGIVGATPCPAGTNAPGNAYPTAGRTSIAGCDTLKAGFYYDGTGPISAKTVKPCKEGFFCATEGKLITPNSATTAAEGLTACPDGTSSTGGSGTQPGPKVVNDCNRLLAGFQFVGTGPDIEDSEVTPCPADTYWGSERTIDTNSWASQLCTECPEGTGVTATPDGPNPGAKTVGQCKKLYEGYYYNAIGSGEISTTTVRPCPANKYCRGWPKVEVNIDTIGTAVPPSDCPPGTKRNASTAREAAWFTSNAGARAVSTPSQSAPTSGGNGGKSIANCDTLVDGWYFDGGASISTTTVDPCPADSWCQTEGTLIVLNTATGVTGGKNSCPTGSGSAVGSKRVNDCNRLKPRLYFTGGNDVTNAIVACPPKSYW